MKEDIWLRTLLDLLGQQPTTVIHSNTLSSIKLTKHTTLHACYKHINIQFHYMHEHVTAKDVLFQYLPIADMHGDIMTNALPHPKHKQFTALLGLSGHCDIPIVTVRGVLKYEMYP